MAMVGASLTASGLPHVLHPWFKIIWSLLEIVGTPSTPTTYYAEDIGQLSNKIQMSNNTKTSAPFLQPQLKTKLFVHLSVYGSPQPWRSKGKQERCHTPPSQRSWLIAVPSCLRQPSLDPLLGAFLASLLQSISAEESAQGCPWVSVTGPKSSSELQSCMETKNLDLSGSTSAH